MNTTKMNATKNIIRFRIGITLAAAILLGSYGTAHAAPPAGVGQMFRLDGGGVTYVFGVNDRGELQALYWGGKLAPGDKFPSAHSLPDQASAPNQTSPCSSPAESGPLDFWLSSREMANHGFA